MKRHKRNVNMTLDEDTIARLAALGEQYAVTRSALVRMIVARYSRKVRPPVEEVQRGSDQG